MSERTRAAIRSVSQRRTKLSSGGRLARTSRWEKGKSTTGGACWASSCSVVVTGELAIPRSNGQACLKKRSCAPTASSFPRLAAGAGGLCARPHERFDPRLVDRASQPFLEIDLWLPAQDLARERDVGLALLRIVGGQRLVDDLRLRPRDLDDGLGQ